ncbi:uncharacterized protein LOC113325284 [Papaver somniferum]|uniref:uncharacterized protein LOC113325284 n=1 Tax=Papaver somniferum TaxID=3469 RepID=UPI000E7008C1|nr:uncharacterized protein LOC113325284 [Papaver somniferum]
MSRGADGLFLSQRKYTLDILSETGLLGAKPASSPIDQHHRLALDDGPLYSNPSQYRRLIGRLIYLTITRPELCYSVHVLAQFMQSPRLSHWEAALRVLRYRKGHPGQGIVLRKDSALQLNSYCDSDWASCPLSRRSLTGYFIFLGGSPIFWKTKKQHTVSRSSAEAEYRSMAHTCSELTWLKTLLKSLGVFYSQPMRLYCDSQSALHIAANLFFMNAQNILRLIVIMYEIKFSLALLLLLMFAQTRSLQTFSPKLWVVLCLSYFFASWAFVIFMLQLEGEY